MCLARAWRLHELAIAALFRAPDAALAELARQLPKAAPLYEAMYQYAIIDDRPNRTKVVERLIKPVFEEIHSQRRADELSDVPDAQAAASSDKAFAEFCKSHLSATSTST